MKPKVGLDRVELDVPPDAVARVGGWSAVALGLGTCLVSAGVAGWLHTLLPPVVDVDVDPTDGLADRVAQLDETFDRAPLPFDLQPIPETLEDYARVRGNALYALVLRDAPLMDLTLAAVRNDEAYVEELDLVAAQSVFLGGPPLPDREHAAPARPLTAERDAWLAGDPSYVVDAIHDIVEVEVNRAARLHYVPALDDDLLLRGHALVRQRDLSPRAVDGSLPPPPPGPLVLEPDVEAAVWAVPSVAPLALHTAVVGTGLGGLVAGLGVAFVGLRMIRRRRVVLSAQGMAIDGQPVDVAQIASVERIGPGVLVTFRSGETLELPDLGHVLSGRVIDALLDPEEAAVPDAPATLQALRAAERA
ncbi:MAG: hypothetical protein H6737_17680 [Alphaproteobacteria bacterium]|nr:hypothetical protein [Alphaproteobacteria bacterium]